MHLLARCKARLLGSIVVGTQGQVFDVSIFNSLGRICGKGEGYKNRVDPHWHFGVNLLGFYAGLGELGVLENALDPMTPLS